LLAQYGLIRTAWQIWITAYSSRTMFQHRSACVIASTWSSCAPLGTPHTPR
jgi:hypothetical protein